MAESSTVEPNALYRRYNAACNAHRFDRLSEFVFQEIEVNGEFQGLPAYVRGLEAIVAAVPDYR